MKSERRRLNGRYNRDTSLLRKTKEVIRMFPVPVVVQAFITGVAAGRQICDLFDD